MSAWSLQDTLNELKFTVTGAGRTGMHYTAIILHKLDFNVGVERLESGRNSKGVINNKDKPSWKRVAFPHGGPMEVSCTWWMVQHLDKYNGPILHQLRHPLLTLSSMVARRMINRSFVSRPKKFSREWKIPNYSKKIYAMKVFTRANEICEERGNPIRTFKIEELDPPLMYDLLDWAGYQRPMKDVISAMTGINTFMGNRHSHIIYNVDSLPYGEDREKFIDQGERYGYDMYEDLGKTRIPLQGIDKKHFDAVDKPSVKRNR